MVEIEGEWGGGAFGAVVGQRQLGGVAVVAGWQG